MEEEDVLFDIDMSTFEAAIRRRQQSIARLNRQIYAIENMMLHRVERHVEAQTRVIVTLTT